MRSPFAAIEASRAAACRDSTGAGALYDDVPKNVALDYHYGDTEKVNAAFAAAKHKVKLKMVNSRTVVASMEPRGCIGEYDKATGRYTFHGGSQGRCRCRSHLHLGFEQRHIIQSTSHVRKSSSIGLSSRSTTARQPAHAITPVSSADDPRLTTSHVCMPPKRMFRVMK